MIENDGKLCILRMFCEARIDAGILTTEITEAGSLGVRRTPKELGWLPSGKITPKIP